MKILTVGDLVGTVGLKKFEKDKKQLLLARKILKKLYSKKWKEEPNFISR